ncbi:MAG: MFS transporter [Actinomycetota bacterium]
MDAPYLHETPRTQGVRGAFSLLKRNRDFRRLYVAQLISFGGDWFLIVALFPLILQLTHSPVMVAVALAAQEIPFFLASPFAGVLADRLNRKRLMVVSDLARAVLCCGFLFIHDESTVWLAFVLLVLTSSFSSVFEPASTAAVPNLVDPEDLSAANALTGSAWGTMLAVGAALGGIVASAFSAHTAFLVDSASFLLSALVLSGIHRAMSRPREPEEEHPGVVEATRETFRYSARDHRVLALLVVKGGFGLAAGLLILLPVFATQVFKAGAIGYGILMAARGVGALIGPFLARWFAGPNDRRLFSAIGLSLATFGVFYGVFSVTPTLILASVAVLGAHLGGGAQWMLSTYGLQRIVPDRIRGRVFAFDLAFITVTITASSLLTGWAADRFGPRATALGLAVVALAWAAAWWTATRRVRRMPLVPAS